MNSWSSISSQQAAPKQKIVCSTFEEFEKIKKKMYTAFLDSSSFTTYIQRDDPLRHNRLKTRGFHLR